ncbi:MAG: hypothetical protein NZM38_04255 [Cytophagales bacterium]|nr:hypothetical protein [Cytophagales bacterium]MDW8383964.1 hypothetical protein [Flammeovirgaceae bacterium]
MDDHKKDSLRSTPSHKGLLRVEIKLVNEELPFSLQTEYKNANGDFYKVGTLMFYLSKIQLFNSLTGESFQDSKSYLIEKSLNRTRLTFDVGWVDTSVVFDVLTLGIGVDSLQNSRLDHKGELDPALGMFWDWVTGYKFFLIEGNYRIQNTSSWQFFEYHIGLNPNYRIQRFDMVNRKLNQPIKFRGGKTTTLILEFDVAEIFKNPHTIDMSAVHSIHDWKDSYLIADNYANGFRAFVFY